MMEQRYLQLVYGKLLQRIIMMESSHGKIFRVTGPLCGEFTGDNKGPVTRKIVALDDVIMKPHTYTQSISFFSLISRQLNFAGKC